MKKFIEKNKKTGILTPILLGSGSAILSTIVTTVVITILVSTEKISMELVSIFAYGTQFLSATIAALIVRAKTSSMKLQTILLCNCVYIVVLFIVGICGYGGHFTGIVIPILMVILGSMTGILSEILTQKGNKRSARKYRYQ